MYYEINVSINGQHLFATAGRSIQTENRLNEVYSLLYARFSREEGYQVSVTRYEKTGYPMKME